MFIVAHTACTYVTLTTQSPRFKLVIEPQCSLSLGKAVESSLLSKFSESEIHRVLASWGRMADGYVHDAPLPGFEIDPMLRQQANSYIDGLPILLFHDEQQYPWVHELERQAAVVAEEFKSVLTAGDLERRANNPWTSLADIRDPATAAYGPEWRTLGLQDR